MFQFSLIKRFHASNLVRFFIPTSFQISNFLNSIIKFSFLILLRHVTSTLLRWTLSLTLSCLLQQQHNLSIFSFESPPQISFSHYFEICDTHAAPINNLPSKLSYFLITCVRTTWAFQLFTFFQFSRQMYHSPWPRIRRYLLAGEQWTWKQYTTKLASVTNTNPIVFRTYSSLNRLLQVLVSVWTIPTVRYSSLVTLLFFPSANAPFKDFKSNARPVGCFNKFPVQPQCII